MALLMIDQRSLLLVGSSLLSGMSHGAQPTLSQQLLDAYFKTAGVCTTSQVENIEDTGQIVTITVSIEPVTRDALPRLSEADRDNWFSLHCPPEIHGVWHQEHPPEDVQVTGTIGEDQSYTLSCVQHQEAYRGQQNRSQASFRSKIEKWLEERLR